MRIHDSLADLIGDTPLVRLDRFGAGLDATLVAKLDLCNPYSIKDRTARWMLESAEREGRIDHDTTILEVTSGNTGLGLAFQCAIKGYRLVLCMSEIQSDERKQLLRALGAQLVLTSADEGTAGARRRALEILESTPNCYYIQQHSNPHNALAHYETTAEELWRDTDGRIDIFVAGLGTAGTLMGVARALKPRKPDMHIVGVEPEIAPMVSQGIFRPHRQAGTSPGFIPKLLERERLDEIMLASETDSFTTCRELGRTEGILAGVSSGMTAWAARELARRPGNHGKLIVAMFADGGERYLSVEGLY